MNKSPKVNTSCVWSICTSKKCGKILKNVHCTDYLAIHAFRKTNLIRHPLHFSLFSMPTLSLQQCLTLSALTLCHVCCLSLLLVQKLWILPDSTLSPPQVSAEYLTHISGPYRMGQHGREVKFWHPRFPTLHDSVYASVKEVLKMLDWKGKLAMS